MPPRSTPPPRRSFYPPNDSSTYRDLLLFEERLKSTAASLQRRKSRYQLFLLQLLITIAFLLAEVLLPPGSSLIAVPYTVLLHWLLPDTYAADSQATIHPYISSGLLFVSVTTLVLFFASGMYSEKIAYANRYVPHANHALRSFNMYLNMRKPPLRSKFYWNPLSFFFPRPADSSSTASSSSPPTPTPKARARSASTSRPIAPIPPATNPRGELIFSSRVDKNFRESYERYRATFERKRETKERLERRKGWLGKLRFWDRDPTPQPLAAGSANQPTQTTPSTSARGRGGGMSRNGTPPSGESARAESSGIMMKQRNTSPMGQGGVVQADRERSQSPPSSSSGRESLRKRSGYRDFRMEDDMRTAALERSFEQGMSQK